MTITYAPAEQADLETLYRLNQKLIEDYEDLSAIDCPKVLAWVRKNLSASLSLFTRVFADGELAGYYSRRPEKGKLERDSLFILPAFQNRGIGTEILKKCQAEAKVPIFLYVFRKNTRAAALYRRMGFQIVKEAGATRWIMEYQKQDR